MTGPWPVSLVETNFHQEMESSETSNVFTRSRKSPCEYTHTGGLRGRVVPSWSFESLLWDISSGFPLASHLALPGSESYLVYLV